MNAVTSADAASGLAATGPDLRISAERDAEAVRHSVGPLLAILSVFWVYVALSNVLYANSMQASFSGMTPGHFFANWDARLLQHAFLYPALLLCVWGSMRVGWRPRLRAIPAQVLIAVAFSILAAPALMYGESLTGDPESPMHHLAKATERPWSSAVERAMWMASATNFFLTYGFGLALINGFALYQRFRDSQLRSASLERELTAAHLATLRMQLSPHTLFNLLHTIRGQISWDPEAAQSMVVQLGDLLRRLLTAGERDFSRLTDEFRFVKLYLELQQKRFADRLTVWIADIDDLPRMWVPSLILQPLVENAVVHGLSGHTGAVVIRVEAFTDGGALTLRVINSMASGAATGRDGIGLRNVRERLALQFGDRAVFTSGESEPGTWVAQIRLPVLGEGPDDRNDVR